MIVTGKDVQNAMIAADINCVDHHQCCICSETVFYLRHGDNLFFDSSCGCAQSAPKNVTWDDAAEWINMQGRADVRNIIRGKFGLTAEAARDIKEQP